MTKSELINQLYLNSDLSQEDATILDNTILDTMQDALGRGERIEIRDFGGIIHTVPQGKLVTIYWSVTDNVAPLTYV